MDWAETTARQDKKHFSFWIWCAIYLRFDGNLKIKFLTQIILSAIHAVVPIENIIPFKNTQSTEDLEKVQILNLNFFYFKSFLF